MKACSIGKEQGSISDQNTNLAQMEDSSIGNESWMTYRHHADSTRVDPWKQL
jgi:hypothetical protein